MIKDAIEAMLKEDIFCALIWDTELNKFIGIFTIRDFLNLFKVIYEKTNNLMQSKYKWSSIKQLVSHLFQRNPIELDDLDVIMEKVENTSKMNSDTKSEKSDLDMHIDVDSDIINYENQMKTFKDFFRIFEYININDYFSDILPVNFFFLSFTLELLCI